MVQRYEQQGWCNVPGGMFKSETGEWVQYTDYLELLELYTKTLIGVKERDNLVALIGDISEVRLDGE